MGRMKVWKGEELTNIAGSTLYTFIVDLDEINGLFGLIFSQNKQSGQVRTL